MSAKTKYQRLVALAEDLVALELGEDVKISEVENQIDKLQKRAARVLAMKNIANPNLKEARAAALKSTKARGAATRKRVMPHIKTMPKDFTLGQIADRLTELKVPSPRGGAWSRMAVKRILDQTDA